MRKENNIFSILQREAINVNNSGLFMLDADTRFDGAVAIPDNTFQYNYTLINHSSSEMNANQIRDKIEPGLVYQVRTQSGLKSFRDNKTTVEYCYYDKNGLLFLKIDIPFEKYSKMSFEEKEEKNRKNASAWGGAFSWAPTGATFGGLIGVFNGLKGCPDAPWNLFLTYGFYGIIIGAVVAGILGFVKRSVLD